MASRPRPTVYELSPRLRQTLRAFLLMDLRRCTATQIAQMEHLGFTTGMVGGYNLTAEGRLLAEFSETLPPGVAVVVSVDPSERPPVRVVSFGNLTSDTGPGTPAMENREVELKLHEPLRDQRKVW